MASVKPHVICVPAPAQGHINPMLKLAKLLYFKGFHVTFILTEFNYQLLLSSRGADAVKGLHDFRFETISDGLPPTSQRRIEDRDSLCITLRTHGLRSFKDLFLKLNCSSDVPNVAFIIYDGSMNFILDVAQEHGIPAMVFFTPSACAMLGYLHFAEVKRRGYFPLKDSNCLTNGYLDTVIDWIPAMEGVRLKDLPTFIRSTNPDDIMFNNCLRSLQNSFNAQGLILNTFDDLEREVLDVIKSQFSVLYTLGPLSMLERNLSQGKLDFMGWNLWKEDIECLSWLDGKESKSVVYVNYGSLTTLRGEQLREFGWGLANSKCPFLWVIRPDLLDGREKIISNELMDEIKGRGILVGWCPQEQVLGHPSVGGFLTHCGWNSTLESISEGVPLICWPSFADQQTNCRFSCSKWGIGMEIDGDVKRDNVENVVRELMAGEKGKKMREKAIAWKKRADVAARHGGSSYTNFDKLVKHLMT